MVSEWIGYRVRDLTGLGGVREYDCWRELCPLGRLLCVDRLVWWGMVWDLTLRGAARVRLPYDPTALLVVGRFFFVPPRPKKDEKPPPPDLLLLDPRFGADR